MSLVIDPRLAKYGLATFQGFFGYSGAEVRGGHPSRNVSRFELGPYRGFLKRQCWIPWKDYVLSWWAGFGFVDRSRREWNTLVALRRRGIPCPEPLAVGTHNGQSFLLLRELEGSIDLTTYLVECKPAPSELRLLARKLAGLLARLHGAGFTHPDLYAKHVFVHRDDLTLALIDFQRTAWHRRVPWRKRWRDLAALDASLGQQLVSENYRQYFLACYLRAARAPQLAGRAVRAIRRRSDYLLRRRKVRAMRHPWQVVSGTQQIEYVRVSFDPISRASG